MKHFKFRKKEYVILEKDMLEDALYVAVTGTNNLWAHGWDSNIEDILVEDQIAIEHVQVYRNIVDKILAALEES